MNIRKSIMEEERVFPTLFASVTKRTYGCLFYHEKNKESHDSNHAILYPDRIKEFENMVVDIKSFYHEKGRTPRIYQPDADGYFAKHKQILESHGFTIEHYGKNKFMLLSDNNRIQSPKRLNINRIYEWDERIARDIYLPAEEEYIIEVVKSSLKNSRYYLFAGFLDDEIAALISFHTSEKGCTRFDYIETAPKHRNNGYAKEILSDTTGFCRENGIQNCFLWPAHQASEHICYQAGFRILFETEAASAVCGSIQKD
ncbi:MAG: hypothetical protein BGN88_15430 [Clostridiales bacterium 43-6]|nr:MAG: hypothetical protein BGN88_15430 [Clostridiales bacterium 43-6]